MSANPESMPIDPTPPAPEPAIVGYCRACGKALDQASVRQSQGTIFCADHVPINMNSPYPGSPYATQPPPPLPPPIADTGVSPGLAFLLGLLPGVGAIYNGQYAKGLVHVLILGTLFTIVSNGSSAEALFGLLIPCFWVYMAFEAYHTAQKRRMGLPVDEFSGLTQAGGKAAAGPVAGILLIAFGALFLLNNLDIVEMRRIVRYWPVLMIGAGVYLLWSRMTKGQNGGGSL